MARKAAILILAVLPLSWRREVTRLATRLLEAEAQRPGLLHFSRVSLYEQSKINTLYTLELQIEP